MDTRKSHHENKRLSLNQRGTTLQRPGTSRNHLTNKDKALATPLHMSVQTNEKLRLSQRKLKGSPSKIPSPSKRLRRTSPLKSITSLHQNSPSITKIVRPSSSSSPKMDTSIQQNMAIQDFQIGKKLGKGKFGKVYCAKHIKSGFIVALKVMSKTEIAHYNITRQFRREVEIQSQLHHQNITNLYGYFYDEKRVYLIMEYCQSGSLYQYLRKKGPLNDITASNFIYQMLLALKYMHSRKIMHRDIKAENILIGSNGKIKFTDFGWSTLYQENSKRKTLCGTVDYLSPELIKDREYTEKVDVWALGIVMYELLCGKPPFEEETKESTYKRIVKRDLKFPTHMSQDAMDLISRFLVLKPNLRISLSDALAHPWIVKNKPYW